MRQCQLLRSDRNTPNRFETMRVPLDGDDHGNLGLPHCLRELGGQRHSPICALYEFSNQGTAIHWRMASSGLGSNINARMDSKHFKTVSAGFQDSFKISKPRWCRHVKHLRRPKTVGCFLNESPRTNDLVQTICFILGVVVSLRLDTFNWFLRDTPQFQAVFAIGVAGGRKRKSPANNKEAQNMS